MVVVGAAAGMVVGYSAAYFSTLTVFMKPIAASLGWGRAQTSAVFMLGMLGLALGAPCLGLMIDKLGAHRAIPASIVLFAIGLFVLPIAPDSVAIFGALTFLLGFVAAGTTPAGYLSVLPPIFDKRLGLALGIAMAGLGLGNALMPVVVQNWISGSGWQVAYRYLSLSVLGGGVIAVVLIFLPLHAQLRANKRDQLTERTSVSGESVREAVRDWRFWLIAIVLFIVSTAGLGAYVHMVPMLTDRGIPTAEAVKVAAITGIGVLIGRAATGLLLDIILAPYVAAAAFLAGSVGLAILAFDQSGSMMVISTGAFLFSYSMGAEGDFIPFFTKRYFGLKHFGFLYGCLFFVFALGGLTGPMLFGITFDRLGGYSMALTPAAVVCMLSAVAMLFLGPYVYAAGDGPSSEQARVTETKAATAAQQGITNVQTPTAAG